MVRRLLVGALIAGAVMATTVATPAAVAVPRTQSTTCSADLLVSFRPGLTLTQQNQTIRSKGSLSSCAGGGVSSATATGMGSGDLSCTSGTATATAKLLWNTGETSKISISVDVSNGSVTGTVVAGKFAGEDVTATLTITPLNGDCLFTPVTKAEATGSISL